MPTLPPCGLYRTTTALGDHVPAGRLVYFHDHGDPGPGVYLPRAWALNRAQWHERGHTVQPEWAATLEPLAPEGLYRVREAFSCCARKCRTYEPDTLVQLGYNGEAGALLFLPEWTPSGLAIPELGTAIDADSVRALAPLRVAQGETPHGAAQ